MRRFALGCESSQFAVQWWDTKIHGMFHDFARDRAEWNFVTFPACLNLITIRRFDVTGSARCGRMPSMEISCQEVRQELANYVEADVTEDLRWRIERHFLSCDGCSALYDGLRQIIYLVGKSDLIELPVGLSQKLYRRLHLRSESSAS